MEQSGSAAHEAREIDEVIERLHDQFPGIDRERIREVVTDAHHQFEGRPIRDYVPVFVERTARAMLQSSPPH